MKSTLYLIKTMTKKKFIAMASLSLILTTLMNMREILLALCIIITIDMITGIRKSLFVNNIKVSIFKKDFWRAIKSSGLRATWRKTYEYAIGIIVFTVLDSLVLKESKISFLGAEYALSELAISTACLVEIYSIHENMEAVSGNNLFKKLLKIFPQKIRGIFNLKNNGA